MALGKARVLEIVGWSSGDQEESELCSDGQAGGLSYKKKPAAMPCDIAAGKGSEERRTADHISKPKPTMGTKSWRILPYFTLLLGGVMICVGNWVT